MVMLIAAVIGLVFGIIGIVDGGTRNWAAWGVIALSVGHIVSQLA